MQKHFRTPSHFETVFFFWNGASFALHQQGSSVKSLISITPCQKTKSSPRSKDMKSIFMTLFLLLHGPLLFAETESEALQAALAAADGDVDKSFFENVVVQKKRQGYTLSYRRLIGDGGNEVSVAQYRPDGSLAEVKSSVDYTSHSMGPMNKHILMQVTRFYDEAGKWVRVKGHIKASLLDTKKNLENRKITRITDEALANLTKPPLRWSFK